MKAAILALLLTCTQAQALVVGQVVMSSWHVASNNCQDVRKSVEELCGMVPECAAKRLAAQQAAEAAERRDTAAAGHATGAAGLSGGHARAQDLLRAHARCEGAAVGSSTYEIPGRATC